MSAVGLGCMGFTHAYGNPVPEEEAIKAIRDSLDFGYTFFDTAECYQGVLDDGMVTYNESILGKAVKGVRDKVVIASKFGVRHEETEIVTDSSPSAIRRAVEGSLKRLGTEYIDLYYQHRIDDRVDPEVVANETAALIREGKIKTWGISEANEEYLRRAHAVCPVTVIQNRYSMMFRNYENLFPVLEELNIGFVAFSPLANGLLCDSYNPFYKFTEQGDYRADMPQFKSEAYEQNSELLGLLRAFAKQKQASPAQISLAWMLAKKPYIVPIPGSRKLHRIWENAKAADITLTPQEVKQIDDALDKMQRSEVFGGHRVTGGENK